MDSPLDLARHGLHFVIHSKEIKPGDLFVALKGDHFDGHDFLDEAAERGAICALVERKIDNPPLPVIEVASCKETLALLAKATLTRLRPKVIAITGSVGKTTTKEFLAALLGSTFETAYSRGNYNSDIGLPLTILNELHEGCSHLVLEMGMRGKGEIAKLCSIAPPDLAIITRIGSSHAQFFHHPSDIAKAKAEILEKAKRALVHNSFPKELWSAISTESFGESDLLFEADGVTLTSLGLKLKKRPDWPLHFYTNFLAAAKAAHFLGVPLEKIAKVYEELRSEKHRFALFRFHGIRVLDDSYNAAPESMEAAFDFVKRIKGRRVALLGSMKELGALSQEAHARMKELAEPLFDSLFLVGSEWGSGALSRDEAFLKCRETLQEDDFLLVKGSNFHALYDFFKEGSLCSFG